MIAGYERSLLQTRILRRDKRLLEIELDDIVKVSKDSCTGLLLPLHELDL